MEELVMEVYQNGSLSGLTLACLASQFCTEVGPACSVLLSGCVSFLKMSVPKILTPFFLARNGP